MPSPSISVVIPVKNEAANIRACIEGILDQTVDVDEIVVVDSGSTDGTLEILNEYPIVKVISIPPEEFNHGETRNVGVKAAEGEFVILTVGDARPANDRWVQELLKGFEDEQVVGVCGQQIVPHERDKNPVEWFRPQSEPSMTRYQFNSPETFLELSPSRQRRICGWDDVTAMYRRDVLVNYPFPRIPFAEDALWARKVLLNGFSIVYNKAARAYHYHPQSYNYTFKRTLTAKYHSYKDFGKTPEKPNFLITYLRKLKVLLQEPRISWTDKLKWALYNLRVLRGQYCAIMAFHRALEEDEKQLDNLYLHHCASPPVPEKK